MRSLVAMSGEVGVHVIWNLNAASTTSYALEPGPAGATSTKMTCSSTGDVDGGAQLLSTLKPGSTSPVHVSVTVPGLAGTRTLPVGGVDASAELPRKAPRASAVSNERKTPNNESRRRFITTSSDPA